MSESRTVTTTPNVVIILLDDIGFADTSVFGGLAQTPELDKLAANGLRYNNFHTAGMCSPTRAALLTGRNHHRVGFGVAELSADFPGYNFRWKASTASIARVLHEHGYSTAAFGKWHNTPYTEVSPVGPFDRWPTGLGFDFFYGFIGGMEDQWDPAALFRNTTPVAPASVAGQRYHLTTDIVDEAIRWLDVRRALAAQRPYFLYFATGAVHEPHHAPAGWIDRYRGTFDAGWDSLRQEIFARQKRLGVVPQDAVLTPRPDQIPAWDSLSAGQRQLYARQMEVYAGFISHTDHEIGRLLRAVQSMPDGANTVVLFIAGDNGSTAEGGLDGFTNADTSVDSQLPHLGDLGGTKAWGQYSGGWGWLGNTPFAGWKGIASHLGATRTPLVVSWPGHIRDRGGLRSQFSHVNDVAATVYDLAAIPFPLSVDGVRQQPLDGVSFAATFDHADALSAHRTQYFEMLGNRAIYHDGWIASARHFTLGFQNTPFDFDYTNDDWELYHVAEDFSQSRNLAKRYPDRLKSLRAQFDREAKSNSVYPLGAALRAPQQSAASASRREFIYFPGMPRLQRTVAPSFSGMSHRISAHVVIPDSGADGIILSHGTRKTGFALYLKDDRLSYERIREGVRETLTSSETLPRGAADLCFEFTIEKGGFGTGSLFINGRSVGTRRLSEFPEARYQYSDTLSVGRAIKVPDGSTVQPPFTFTGTLSDVEVTLK